MLLRWCCWTTFRGDEGSLGLPGGFLFRAVLSLAAVTGTMDHWALAKDLRRAEPVLALEVACIWEEARCFWEPVRKLFEFVVVRDSLSSWRGNKKFKKLIKDIKNVLYSAGKAMLTQTVRVSCSPPPAVPEPWPSAAPLPVDTLLHLQVVLDAGAWNCSVSAHFNIFGIE